MNFGSKLNDLSACGYCKELRCSSVLKTQYAPLRLYVSHKILFLKDFHRRFLVQLGIIPKSDSRHRQSASWEVLPPSPSHDNSLQPRRTSQTNPNHRSMSTEQILNAREHTAVLSGHAASHLSWKCLIGH
jgi:hypothetical protein